MKIRFAFLLLIVGSVATVSSCTRRPLANLNPCTINGVVQSVPVNPQRALDLLILIDDSQSMSEEQAKLAEQVPRLVNLLLTGGVDTDGVSMPVGDFPAVESLHVAVITPDLGYSTEPPTGIEPSGNFDPTGACTASGKAGFMQVTGRVGTPQECSAQTPPEGTLYLNFPEPPFNRDDFISDVTCVAGVTGEVPGCGFEQQLEAILASNRNTANGGFSREDALLAIIMITDEDDCSATDPRVFDTVERPGNLYQGPFADPPTNSLVQFNLRCSAHKGALQQIQRYVDGIANLKSDPSQVVFAAITGIPEDSALDPENFNTDADRYNAILAHPGMAEVPNPADDGAQDQALTPACIADDGSGAAAPGVRIVETIQGLAGSNAGVGTVVESICADDYAPALNAIVDRIAAALRQLCLPRELNRNSAKMVGCEVREVQPVGDECDEARGRVLIGTEDVGPAGESDVRNVCRITQLPSDPAAGVPEGLGWFYDDFTAETEAACSFNEKRQRVSFTENADPVSGARVRFECLQTAPPQTEDVGWPCTSDALCDPNPDNCLEGEAVTTAECEADPTNCCETRILKERYDRDNLELVCDTETNTCQLTCESNVQCPGGYACFDENEDGSSYCVNPTCTLN